MPLLTGFCRLVILFTRPGRMARNVTWQQLDDKSPEYGAWLKSMLAS